MTLLIVSFLLLFLSSLITCNADDQEQPVPDPGFSPVDKFKRISFAKGFKPLWGQDHQYVDDDGVLYLMMNKSSGSGFVSSGEYDTLYFGADIKLPDVSYSAGLDISFYLSSNDDCSINHDEIDIEFLGSRDNNHYQLQTNVIITDHSSLGGVVNKLGREQKFNLWFDPTKDFHNYAVVKTHKAIIFFVDGKPIRRFVNFRNGLYPKLDLKAYGSIWDASDWATENGLYKVDYSYAPFIAEYQNFQLTACKDQECSVTGSGKLGLSTAQKYTMKFIQQKYMIYNYCTNIADPSLEFECKNAK